VLSCDAEPKTRGQHAVRLKPLGEKLSSASAPSLPLLCLSSASHLPMPTLLLGVNSDNRGSLADSLVPSVHIRVVGLDNSLQTDLSIVNNLNPWEEGSISNGKVVTSNVLLSVKNSVQDLVDSLGLVGVSLNSCGDLVSRLVDKEPVDLSLRRSMTRDLEEEEGENVSFFLSILSSKLVLAVVSLLQVLKDCSGFPDLHIVVVGINDGRDTSIGVDSQVVRVLGSIGTIFEIMKLLKHCLIGNVQLLQ